MDKRGLQTARKIGRYTFQSKPSWRSPLVEPKRSDRLRQNLSAHLQLTAEIVVMDHKIAHPGRHREVFPVREPVERLPGRRGISLVN
jgi:hypothetical protein